MLTTKAFLDVAPVSDIIAIKAPDTFQRPIYAGNVIATVKSIDSIKVRFATTSVANFVQLVTVRGTSFPKADLGDAEVPIEKVDAPAAAEPAKLTFISASVKVLSLPVHIAYSRWQDSEKPDLRTARVVVSGGRGLKSGENFKLLDELAAKLGGAGAFSSAS